MMKYDQRIFLWRLPNRKRGFPWKYCTLKLCHHVPSTYTLYRLYRAFWGILREQIVRVLLPTFSLGDYHERLHPTSYFSSAMLQKITTLHPILGRTCSSSLWMSLFFRVCFILQPLKTKGCVSLLFFQIWLNAKGNLLTCHLFGASEAFGFYLGFIANPVFVCLFYCFPVQEELSVPPSSKPLEVKLMQRRITIGAKRIQGRTVKRREKQTGRDLCCKPKIPQNIWSES